MVMKRDLVINKSIDVKWAGVEKMVEVLEAKLSHLSSSMNPAD